VGFYGKSAKNGKKTKDMKKLNHIIQVIGGLLILLIVPLLIANIWVNTWIYLLIDIILIIFCYIADNKTSKT
jgi:hypothetical protein